MLSPCPKPRQQSVRLHHCFVDKRSPVDSCKALSRMLEYSLPLRFKEPEKGGRKFLDGNSSIPLKAQSSHNRRVDGLGTLPVRSADLIENGLPVRATPQMRS